jgi:hypothetical protein
MLSFYKEKNFKLLDFFSVGKFFSAVFVHEAAAMCCFARLP